VGNCNVNFGQTKKKIIFLNVIITNNVISTIHKPKIITFIMNGCDFVPLCLLNLIIWCQHECTNNLPKIPPKPTKIYILFPILTLGLNQSVNYIAHNRHGNEKVNNIHIQPTTSFISFYVTCPMSPRYKKGRKKR